MQDENWNMFKHLLQSWSVAYEKAILKYHADLSKMVIDEACCEAVENWTQRLYETGKIPEIRGKEFQDIRECINHHIDNLIAGDMWSEHDRPKIQDLPEPQVVKIVVPRCNYMEGCSWHLEEKHFSDPRRFPCQRVGCFVGAVNKYLKEDRLSDQEKVDYFMTKVHSEKGCMAILFVSEGFTRRKLLAKYQIQGGK